MTPTLDIQDGSLVLDCSDIHTALARSVPGMSYNRKVKRWVAPLSPLAVQAAWDTFRNRAEMTETVLDYMREQTRRVKHLSAVKAGEFREETAARYPMETQKLWPLQIDGVRFLVDAEQAFLCDSMGSGKTIQCYRALDVISRTESPFPALVVANKSALYSTWEAEAKWCNHARKVVVVDGTAPQRRKAFEEAEDADVVIIGWELLAKHSRLDPYGNVSLSEDEKTPKELNAIPFRTVIIDEAHRGKNWRAKRTRALWSVAHGPSVRWRWALTGTPVTGYEEDVWAIGHGVQPDMYPRKTQWFDRYVNYKTLPGQDYPIVLGFEPAHYDEMIKWLDPFMLRRTKAEIIPNYQGKLPVRTVEVKMGAKQAKAYKQMKDHMLAEGDGGILAAPSPIEQLLRLNQFAAATPVIEEGDDGTLKVTGLSMPSTKIDALLELIEELGDEPAVVFSESRLLIDLAAEQLAKAGVSYMRITGAEDTLLRTANVQAFQNGEVQIALCTYGAGAESITLNRADTVIRLQRTYSYVADSQAPDRADRGERKAPVQIIDIVTENTVEYAVHSRIHEKDSVFQQVVRDALKEEIP